MTDQAAELETAGKNTFRPDGRLLGLFFVLFGKAFPVSHFSSADCRYDDYTFSYDDRTTSRRGLR